MSTDLALIALSLLIWGFGESCFLSFQPLYLQQLGANPVDIGLILGAFGMMGAITHIPSGYLADRIGRRPILIASWLLGVFSTWMMAISPNLPWFIGGMLLYGMTLFVMAPLNSYVTEARGNWSVGRALTLSSAAYNLGAILGPVLGGVMGERFGFRSIFIFAACIFLLSTVFILRLKPQPVTQPSEHARIRDLLSGSRFLLFIPVFFLAIFAMYLSQPLSPNYLQNQYGLSLVRIGQLYSIFGIGIVVLNLVLGRLDSRLGFLIGQAAVFGFALCLWLGKGFPGFALGYFLLGGFRVARSLGTAQVRSLVHLANLGLAYGLTETAASLATILAPLLAGFLYDRKPEWIYALSAGLILISIAITAWKVAWHPGLEENDEFVNSDRRSATSDQGLETGD